MYRDPEAKKAIADHADADEAEEGEEAQEDAAVQNTMKTFEGEGAADEDEEGEDDGENWAQGQTAGGDYAKWVWTATKVSLFFLSQLVTQASEAYLPDTSRSS